MIYAVKMHEYNKRAGYLRRRWAKVGWSKQFRAGDATPRRRFIPSRIDEVSKEEYEYLTGRDEAGNPIVAQPRNPSLPVFKGFKFESRRELMAMAQREAEKRASHGGNNTRALVHLMGPLEPVQQQVVRKMPVVEEEKALDEFKPIDVKKALEGEKSDGEEPDEEPELEVEEKPKTQTRRRGRKRNSDPT